LPGGTAPPRTTASLLPPPSQVMDSLPGRGMEAGQERTLVLRAPPGRDSRDGEPCTGGVPRTDVVAVLPATIRRIGHGSTSALTRRLRRPLRAITRANTRVTSALQREALPPKGCRRRRFRPRQERPPPTSSRRQRPGMPQRGSMGKDGVPDGQNRAAQRCKKKGALKAPPAAGTASPPGPWRTSPPLGGDACVPPCPPFGTNYTRYPAYIGKTRRLQRNQTALTARCVPAGPAPRAGQRDPAGKGRLQAARTPPARRCPQDISAPPASRPWHHRDALPTPDYTAIIFRLHGAHFIRPSGRAPRNSWRTVKHFADLGRSGRVLGCLAVAVSRFGREPRDGLPAPNAGTSGADARLGSDRIPVAEGPGLLVVPGGPAGCDVSPGPPLPVAVGRNSGRFGPPGLQHDALTPAGGNAGGVLAAKLGPP